MNVFDNPASDVSLYNGFISCPVFFMVNITLSKETFLVFHKKLAKFTELIARISATHYVLYMEFAPIRKPDHRLVPNDLQ